eukprot:TRINITY_DN342_c0_g1_i3.p1 TRINITY_DN342_c0_g1~~TRINITY_DN342_c0_g1_i3.p1  ORF type:complete len:727 (-),score=231.39 TRINITY_DN342_c0_g1_i3:524-2704(-)
MSARMQALLLSALFLCFCAPAQSIQQVKPEDAGIHGLSPVASPTPGLALGDVLGSIASLTKKASLLAAKQGSEKKVAKKAKQVKHLRKKIVKRVQQVKHLRHGHANAPTAAAPIKDASKKLAKSSVPTVQKAEQLHSPPQDVLASLASMTERVNQMAAKTAQQSSEKSSEKRQAHKHKHKRMQKVAAPIKDASKKLAKSSVPTVQKAEQLHSPPQDVLASLASMTERVNQMAAKTAQQSSEKSSEKRQAHKHKHKKAQKAKKEEPSHVEAVAHEKKAVKTPSVAHQQVSKKAAKDEKKKKQKAAALIAQKQTVKEPFFAREKAAEPTSFELKDDAGTEALIKEEPPQVSNVALKLSALAEETSVNMATTRSETKMLKTKKKNKEQAALASSSDDGYWNMRPIITGCFHECGSDLDCMTLCQVCVERASCKNVLDNCGECKTKVQESKKKAKQTPDLHRDGGGIRLASERLKQEVLDLRLKANREKKKLGELEENLVKARRQADWSKAVRQQARKSQEQAEKHLMKKKGEDAAWRLKYAKKFKDLRQALASNTGKKQRLRQQIKKAETLIEHAKLHLQKAEEKKNEKSIKSAKQVLKKVQATRKFLEEKQKRMNQEADKQNSKIEGVKKDNRWMARGMGDETQKAIKVVEDAEHKVKIATKKEKLDLEAVKVKIADVHKVVKEVKRLNEEADDAEKQLAKVGVPKEEPAPKTALLNIGELTSSTESM